MASPPPTRVEVVVDELHGVDVADPYRWLEDDEAGDVQAWVAAQNRYTREALDARPDRERWRERLVSLMGLPVVMSAAVRGDRVITHERLTGEDQFVLGLRSAPELAGLPVVLLDPAAGEDDAAVAVDWYEPTVDGRFVALGMSEGGTEDSTLRILDVDATVAAGDPVLLDEAIPHTRACSVAWEPDAAGFFYTRYPDGDEYHRTVHHHTVGTDWHDDPVVWAEHVTPETWPSVDLSPDGRWILVHAMVGWGRTDVVVLDRTERPEWRTVVAGEAATSSFVFDRAGTGLVGTTTHGAPMGRVVGASLEQPAEWTTVVAERDVVVGGLTVAGDELLVVATEHAVDTLERWSAEGVRLGEVPGLGIATVAALSADRATGFAVAVTSTFEAPNRVVALPTTGPARVVPTAGPAATDPDAVIPALAVSRASCPSADGTEIGMFVIHADGESPGPDTPTILTGYGGFAIAMTPAWSPLIAAWCERGGAFVVAGLRGGVEHGDDWHHAGRRSNKQNVFDDFHAVADWLVETGRTSRERLGIDGRSNGGLLVGVALTQRPDLCRAVSCGVPLLDMIRFPQFLIARLWTDEYGDPDVAEEFAWLHAYSPYHRVDDGTCYPATLLWTAEGDTRVAALHARKMAARLQAATGCDDAHPVLLHQEGRAGHGVGKPVGKRADEQADVLAFFSWQLAARQGEHGG